MESLREHWLTWLSLLFAAFLVGIGLVGAVDLDESAGARVAFLLVLVPLGVALLLGLWLLREGRAIPAAYVLIVVPLVLAGLGFFWLLFIPTIVALVVIVFGVIKGGLARELRPA